MPKWEVEQSRFYPAQYQIKVSDDDGSHYYICHGITEKNAKLICKCVNACSGIAKPQEYIDKMADMAACVVKAEEQSDALLEALDGINPEAVPKLLNTLKNCVVDAKQALSQAERKNRIKAAEDIIAMAEGGE